MKVYVVKFEGKPVNVFLDKMRAHAWAEANYDENDDILVEAHQILPLGSL